MAGPTQHVATVQQVAADTAAGISMTSAGYVWLSTANDVAQLVATIVAIVAGAAAAWWHIDRVMAARKERALDDD